MTGSLPSRLFFSGPLLILAALAAGCGANPEAPAEAKSATEVAVVDVTTAAAVERPIARFVRVTGTLTAEEQAEVAAEIAGRVVATPVERGSRVSAGSELVRITDVEVRAQAQEAEANAGQIEARLGLTDGGQFLIDRVPEVANAVAARDLALADLDRAQMLLDRKLLPQADFERSRTQAEAARRQYDIARNTAEQQYQSLLAARARMTLAQKALTDTAVRAPFDGLVEQRLVSVGDYVTRGTKVASVIRINPLRVELTVPGQYLSEVATGRAVTLEVDAFRGQTFTGRIRYVSPVLRTDTRALVVEAVVPNDSGRLKPGLFATARIEQASETPAVLVPATAVRSVSGTARVYVITTDRTAEERLVTTGQTVGDLVEITSGLKAGDTVATSNVAQLTDGVRIAEGK
ncbi:MAG: efflux RND transporter periplasmic adaptor subunit [Vicinamibacterales bacterium]